MGAIPCEKCGKLRKWGTTSTPEGLWSPPCHHCGDPGFLERDEEDDDKHPGMS